MQKQVDLTVNQFKHFHFSGISGFHIDFICIVLAVLNSGQPSANIVDEIDSSDIDSNEEIDSFADMPLEPPQYYEDTGKSRFTCSINFVHFIIFSLFLQLQIMILKSKI